MGRLPTIKIDNPHEPGGYIIINLSDFDPSTMTEWGVEKPPDTGHEQPEPPKDPAVRAAAIYEAFGKVDPDKDELWTGRYGGRKPTVTALEDILGWQITAAERDEAAEARRV